MEANPWESSTEYIIDVGAAEKCLKTFQNIHKIPYFNVLFNIIRALTRKKQGLRAKWFGVAKESLSSKMLDVLREQIKETTTLINLLQKTHWLQEANSFYDFLFPQPLSMQLIHINYTELI